jgi:hypothetical protein
VHRANTPILGQSSGLKIHTALPGNAGYAHGWVVTARSWAGGDGLTHTGSNNQWYSVIWLAPAKDFAVVASCNLGGTSAFNAIDAAVGQAIQLFL